MNIEINYLTNPDVWTNKLTWIVVVYLEKECTTSVHQEILENACLMAYDVESFAAYLKEYVEDLRDDTHEREQYDLFKDILNTALNEFIDWEEIANFYFEFVEMEDLKNE